jgi:hypothetical protein
MMGKNEPRKMRKIAARSPTPKKMIATGIHAMGLMGLKIWSTGLTTSFAAGLQPSHSPRGIPTKTAAPKPSATRRSESPMSAHRTCLWSSSATAFSTLRGEGKILVAVHATE